MNKKILIGLTIVAVLIYAWDVWIILGKPAMESSQKKRSSVETINRVVITKECSFVAVKRSPFQGEKPKPKPMPVEKKVETPKPIVKAPNVTINGIMWSEAKPLVMVQLPNGSTQMVKVGDEILGRIIVKKIEKNRMQIVYKETLFWIER